MPTLLFFKSEILNLRSRPALVRPLPLAKCLDMCHDILYPWRVNKTLAVQLKELRGSQLLSQEAFARLLGVSVRTVVRWENGKTNPSPLAHTKLREIVSQNEKGRV